MGILPHHGCSAGMNRTGGLICCHAPSPIPKCHCEEAAEVQDGASVFIFPAPTPCRRKCRLSPDLHCSRFHLLMVGNRPAPTSHFRALGRSPKLAQSVDSSMLGCRRGGSLSLGQAGVTSASLQNESYRGLVSGAKSYRGSSCPPPHCPLNSPPLSFAWTGASPPRSSPQCSVRGSGFQRWECGRFSGELTWSLELVLSALG